MLGAALPPGWIISPWSCLPSEPPPREESDTSASEVALGHLLVVLGQLLPTAGPPADTPALPAVIPVAKWTYAEAAVTPALERRIDINIFFKLGSIPPQKPKI